MTNCDVTADVIGDVIENDGAIDGDVVDDGAAADPGEAVVTPSGTEKSTTGDAGTPPLGREKPLSTAQR